MISAPQPPVSQERLREIAWEVGKCFEQKRRLDEIHFSFVNPRLGFLWWGLHASDANSGGNLVLRIHDVTDVLFDGTNSHRFFDISVDPGRQTHYLHHDQLGRHLLAEIGVRLEEGGFRALARSNAVFFDRDRPAPEMRHDGMFVHHRAGMEFPVENIADAPVFEQLVEQLPADRLDAAPLKIAVVYHTHESPGRIESISRICASMRKMGCLVDTYPVDGHEGTPPLPSWPAEPDIVHCHGWVTAAIGARAKRESGCRFVLHLHSADLDWPAGSGEPPQALSADQVDSLMAADVLAVAHSSTRSILTEIHGVDPASVVIIDEPAETRETPRGNPAEIKRRFHLHPDQPMILFCGEISHAAGADLLVDCLGHVCSEYPNAQFVFAGDGPLRGELEGRVNSLGLGGRVRFTGHVPGPVFEDLLTACEFVALPARTWQGEGVAQAAIDAGKAVLTTHQAHIGCVRHGENGLLAYDNPGSIIWGLKEMLANPPHAQMGRAALRREQTSADIAAFELFIACRRALHTGKESRHDAHRQGDKQSS